VLPASWRIYEVRFGMDQVEHLVVDQVEHLDQVF
jgi:hypothetical protein